MKTWGVVCSLLSTALLAAFVTSMHSCTDRYQIGPQGQLFKTASETPPAKTASGATLTWASEFPHFPTLERWVRPGDRIELTRTHAGFWIFDFEMRKFEAFRGEESAVMARDGHIRFWGLILAISLFPMICWGIGVFWIVALSPKRHRHHGDEPP